MPAHTGTLRGVPVCLRIGRGPALTIRSRTRSLEGLLVVLQFVLSSVTSVRCSCRNFGTRIVSLVLPLVLYVVMGRSVTSVRSTRSGPERRGGSFTVLCITGTLMFWDFGSSHMRRCGVLNAATLRRPQRQLLRHRVQSKDCATALPVLVFVVSAECVPSALQACGSAFGLSVSSTGNFNISILDHMKKLKYNAFVGAVLRFSIIMSVSAENRGGAGPARLQDRRRASVLQRQTQQSRQSGVVEAPQIQS